MDDKKSPIDFLGYFPDKLHIEQIATFECHHRSSQLVYVKKLLNACERGELKSDIGQYEDWWIHGFPDDFRWWYIQLDICEGPTAVIHRVDYCEWLKRQDLPVPVWWFPTDPIITALMTADEKRIPILLKAIQEFGFHHLDIPRGGKNQLREHLIAKYPGKFTTDKFENTWQAGKRKKLLKMRDG